MIHITRPVPKTHKTVPKTIDKPLDNNLRERQPIPIEERQNYKGAERQFQREDLEKAVDDTNRMIFSDDRRFEFKVHERTGRIMVKLIDKESDEVIKEIPPEKILDLVASIWDLVGILVDERG